MLSKRASNLIGKEVWYYELSVVDGDIVVKYKKLKVVGVFVVGDDELLVDELDHRKVKEKYAFVTLKKATAFIAKNVDALVAAYDADLDE